VVCDERSSPPPGPPPHLKFFLVAHFLVSLVPNVNHEIDSLVKAGVIGVNGCKIHHSSSHRTALHLNRDRSAAVDPEDGPVLVRAANGVTKEERSDDGVEILP